jgi:Protein of unknown function (DUF3738)
VPARGGRGNIEFLPGGGRFSATHVPLGALIQKAYNFTSPQCHAKAEHPLSAAEMLRLLQNLLEDRFKLVLRRETKEIQASPVVLHILMTPLRSIPTTHGEWKDTPITRWISLFRTLPWPTLRGAFPR